MTPTSGRATGHKQSPTRQQLLRPAGDPGKVRWVPNTPGTPRRSIRVPDELWDAAQAKADERGENLSDVLRRALEEYVRQT